MFVYQIQMMQGRNAKKEIKRMSKYYAVAKGFIPGIYASWEEAEKQIEGFSNPIHARFFTMADAVKFMQRHESDLLKKMSVIQQPADAVLKVAGHAAQLNTGSELIAGFELLPKTAHFEKVTAFIKHHEPDMKQSYSALSQLSATIHGLETAIAMGLTSVRVDYSYEGVEKFATYAWETNSPATIAYKQKMQQLMSQLNVSFHASDELYALQVETFRQHTI